MADTLTGTSFPNSQFGTVTDPKMAGTWQTVEQAAVALGLSVRTVNRHISAQKLKSRLMDGRREVFVPIVDLGKPETQPTNTDIPDTSNPPIVEDPSGASVSSPTTSNPAQLSPEEPDESKVKTGSFLDLDTAIAMADRKADRQVEMAVSIYQSLTRSIETQAHKAKRTATIAWCIVGVLTIGVTVALVWTATRVTRAETDSQHLKQQADVDAERLKEQVEQADKRADNQEKELADIQQKLSEAQQQAARAEGRAAVYEEMQSHQPPASQPATRPSLIDRLTTAFGSGQ